MTDWIGWLATVLFTLSYFSKNPVVLRLVQALAAVLWIIYGISVRATPVVVANGLVAAMALISARRKITGDRATENSVGQLALAAREKRAGHL